MASDSPYQTVVHNLGAGQGDVTTLTGQTVIGQLVADTVTVAPGATDISSSGKPEVTPPAKAALWNIPKPVRSFTDREAEVTQLANQLVRITHNLTVRTFALHGMGGVGKTQLARAYAHRYFDHYELGWWISAETVTTTETMLAELARRLGAPADLSSKHLAAQLPILLAERSGWLLIFDNSTEPSDLEPFLPYAGNGHVLITSRNQGWGGVAEPMSVDLLPLDAAVELLQVRSQDPDDAAARELAVELGRLSLALEQAAAYCAEYQISLAYYLELFRARRADLLKRGKPLAYEGGTVDTVFHLLVEQIRSISPQAVQLLQLCALLAPDQIPVTEILDHPAHLPQPLRKAAADPISKNDILGLLYRTRLLIKDTGETARIHRLVRDVIVGHAKKDTLVQRVTRLIALFNAIFPKTPGSLETRSTCARLAAHADTLIARGSELEISTLAFAALLDRVAYYLLVWTTDMEGAGALQEHALAIRRHLKPIEDADTAVSLNGLATTMRHMGRLRRSRALHEQALAVHHKVHPGDHTDTSITLTDLSFTCSRLGDGEAAYRYGEQALTMRRRLYRGDHVDIVISLNDLGVALRQMGEMARANDLHEEALAMALRLYSDDHPETAQSFYELGVTRRELGQREDAFSFAEQGLEMRERLHAGDHRHTARSLQDLAIISRLLGRIHQSRALCEQAIAMRQRLHPGDHPETAQSLIELSRAERASGNLQVAEHLERQAGAMRERLELIEQRNRGTTAGDDVHG